MCQGSTQNQQESGLQAGAAATTVTIPPVTVTFSNLMKASYMNLCTRTRVPAKERGTSSPLTWGAL